MGLANSPTAIYLIPIVLIGAALIGIFQYLSERNKPAASTPEEAASQAVETSAEVEGQAPAPVQAEQPGQPRHPTREQDLRWSIAMLVLGLVVLALILIFNR